MLQKDVTSLIRIILDAFIFSVQCPFKGGMAALTLWKMLRNDIKGDNAIIEYLPPDYTS